jgi:NADH dehydrogenase
LANFGDRLSGKAAGELQRMGVELQMDRRVVGVDPIGVDVQTHDGKERIDAATTIWAAGVQASPLAAQLAEASGAETDRAGRIAVRPDLTLPGHPEVFALGDMVSLNHLPGVAEVAMQGGVHAAHTIRRRLKGDTKDVPFKYRDLGSAAAVGRRKAIVSARGLRLSGLPGWIVWMFIHIGFLNGFGNRVRTLFRWNRSMMGKARPERVFSVGHTGGDLSLPEEVRTKVMPSPFPVMDATLRQVKEDRSATDGEPDASGEQSSRAVSEGRGTAEAEKR